MDESAIMAEVNRLYDPLRPAIRKEMQDAAVMEPSLAEMYFPGIRLMPTRTAPHVSP